MLEDSVATSPLHFLISGNNNPTSPIKHPSLPEGATVALLGGAEEWVRLLAKSQLQRASSCQGGNILGIRAKLQSFSHSSLISYYPVILSVCMRLPNSTSWALAFPQGLQQSVRQTQEIKSWEELLKDARGSPNTTDSRDNFQLRAKPLPPKKVLKLRALAFTPCKAH